MTLATIPEASASTLRHKPDEPAIKALLIACLETHFGSLQGAVQ